MTTISATKARANLYDLIEQVASSGKRIAITKKGQIKVVLISYKEYEAWRTLSAKFITED